MTYFKFVKVSYSIYSLQYSLLLNVSITFKNAYYYRNAEQPFKDMKKYWLLVFFIPLLTSLVAKTSYEITAELNWDKDPIIYVSPDELQFEIYKFEGAGAHDAFPVLPFYRHRTSLDGPGKLTIEILEVQYESFTKNEGPEDVVIGEDLIFETNVTQNKNKFFGMVDFIPIIKTGSNQYKRVTSIKLKVTHSPSTATGTTKSPNTYNSVLEVGDVYKLSIARTGVHRISADMLSEMGIDVGSIDPKKIKIFGNGGGLLPEPIDEFRYDDLEENAIFVSGEADGSFDNNDYILFYAENKDKWRYNADNDQFRHETDIYDDSNYYFLKVDVSNGLRISDQASISSTTYSSTSFDDYAHFEEDKINLLRSYVSAQGSGKRWFGDSFKATRERTYDFNFPNLIQSEPVKIIASFAGRYDSQTSFKALIGEESLTQSINQISTSSNQGYYANEGLMNQSFLTNNNAFTITISYPAIGDGSNEGWLDYITLNCRKNLKMFGDQMSFRDTKSLTQSSTTFRVTEINPSTTIWDITDPLKPKKQLGTFNNNEFSFGVATMPDLKEFIAFTGNNFYSPTIVGKVENQNLHAIDQVDMVVVYHPLFEAAVDRFIEHRSSHSGLVIAKAEISQIYNEFACGNKDITAIRDFAEMIHFRNPNFRYILLFGDGSFDYRNILELPEERTHQFIPPYETHESFEVIDSSPSDDYYTLLSPGEGIINANDDLDIAIGRFPVKTIQEAENVVNKIIRYDTDPVTLGDWRNRIAFIGDDEDGNRHVTDADEVSSIIEENHCEFNIDKVYFDALQQVSTPGGERFPSATEAINNNMFKGLLAINYLGHGGSQGWAQERVLQIPDINSWNNQNKLPLFVTATCSFTGYDEPDYVTGGELTFLNPNGGAIGLLTTVRAVFAHSNKQLAKAVFDRIFNKVDGEYYTIGELIRVAKNNAATNATNSRKFTLIGDPSMHLAIPEFGVTTLKINGSAIDSVNVDTISALQEVEIEGAVVDEAGNIMTNFNGKVFPTIFDKAKTITTLGQNSGSSPFSFELQKNIIFKGAASVIDGYFSFKFIVPKDIDYQFGNAKISYYAHDEVERDAAGFMKELIVGGTDPNAIVDDQGPLVEVYMNTEEFAFGGLTDENPTLLVKLEDDLGINVAGSAIGHDLTGVLDDDTQNSYQLNDFYEAELDNYKKGTVRYPLSQLAEGRHKITVKAWDVANNSAEGFTEFVVASDGKVALDHVFNYPNPFTDHTDFQFEHNLPGQSMDVQVQIFTVSGRLVKTIQQNIYAEGYRITNELTWDGKDEFGDQLGRGVYLYKIKIRADQGSENYLKSESEFEKLVILK